MVLDFKDGRKTGVDHVSIEVETIVFYKTGKQARPKEILNTIDCFLAPSEYPLKTAEITEEYESPVKIGVLRKNLNLRLPAVEVGVLESESGLMQTLSPGQLKSLGIANVPTACDPNPCFYGGSCKIVGSSGECKCTIGYIGSTCRNDLDECTNGTHTCDGNATCVNSVGSYSCTCNNGFAGGTAPGSVCSDIDECKTLSHGCQLNCSNTVGSFSCYCPPTYRINPSDNKKCDDIDECTADIHNCHNQAICQNSVGSHSCTCNARYTGNGTYCRDIDECIEGGHNCHTNANCANSVGSFTCRCKVGYTGDGINCREDRLFPVDENRQTTRSGFIENTNRGRHYIAIPEGISFGTGIYKYLYIDVDGYLVIGQRRRQWPFRRGNAFRNGIRIVAPFGADIELGQSVDPTGNKLYYSFHRRTDTHSFDKDIINRTSNYVRTYGGIADFNTFWAVLATWKQVTPRPSRYYYHSGQLATFQVCLVTDGKNTFSIFIYDDNGMNWKSPWLPAMAGYRLNPSTQLSERFDAPLGSAFFAFDTVVGNTQKKGQWIHKLATNLDNSAASCYKWYDGQIANYYAQRLTTRAFDCPCRSFQAFWDRRFRWSGILRVDSDNFLSVYDSRRIVIFIGTPISYFQKCCYDARGALVKGIIPNSEIPTTQHYVSIVYQWWQLWFVRYFRPVARENALREDKNAFRDCCVNSDLCQLYEEKRPLPKCEKYVPPRRALLWGDPHMTTLDGKTFTFNGLGDYTMIKLLNNTNTTTGFNFQARSCRAVANATGNTPQATVFCAFAVTEDQGALVEIYMNVSSGELTFLVNKKSEDLNSYNTTQSVNGTDILWSVTNSTKTLSINFESGAAVDVNVLTSMLTTTVSAIDDFTDRTRGLLGVSNGNVSDDFTAPDGSIISINSTQREIYYGFGILWNVTGSESLFSISNPDNDPSFIPDFLDDLSKLFGNNTELRDKAIATCTRENFQCLFDIFQTNDFTSATENKVTTQEFKNVDSILNTYPPTISGPLILNIVRAEQFNLTISASSNSSTNLTYSLRTNGTSVTSSNSATGVFTLVVTQQTNFSVEYVVSDENANTALLRPTLYYCYCLNNATCNASQANLFSSASDVYINYRACSCTPGYEGAFCETLVNLCEQNPCFTNVSCTDNHVTNTADCDSCPANYVGDGRQCTDFDECQENVANCSQSCVNFLGGYSCGCQSGYILKGRTQCEDIDECIDTAHRHNCHQNATCRNYPGNFTCTCDLGFSGNGTECTDVNECGSNQLNMCNQNCTNTFGSYQCSCYNGYRFLPNNITYCEDIDECKENTSNCHSDAACNNTAGSFTCTCRTGFSGNGTYCKDINECTSGTETCHPNANCHNTHGSHECTCKPGYSGNGFLCIDVDECTVGTHTCHTNATCQNTAGSSSCTCKSGFTGNGTYCANECTIGSHNCHSNATCFVLGAAKICTCKSGFAGNGSYCEDVNECTNGTHNCHLNALCQNDIGSFTCSCSSGYTGNGISCTVIPTQPPTPTKVTPIVEQRRYKAELTTFNVTINNKLLNTSDPVTQRRLSDPNDSLYKETKNTMEPQIFNQVKVTLPEIERINITGFGFGSLIVNFHMIFPSTFTRTETFVRDNLVLAFANKTYRYLNGTFSTSAFTLSDLDECKAGGYCDINANCQNFAGFYSCTCKSGYEGTGRTCTKTTETDNTALAIGLSIAAFILVVVIFILVARYKKKKRNKTRAEDPIYQSQFMFDNWTFSNRQRLRARVTLPPGVYRDEPVRGLSYTDIVDGGDRRESESSEEKKKEDKDTEFHFNA